MKPTAEEEVQAHDIYMNHVRAEVEWYQLHGKHADRLHITSDGVQFVIGDWSWNRKNPDRQESVENYLPR